MENKNMSLGFAIDKPQTFQIIESLLRKAISKGHPCTVYSCTDITTVFSEKERRSFKNIVISDKNLLISTVSECVTDYSAFIGINLFNKGWNKLYAKDVENLFALEYCWNEIYNTGVSVSSQGLGFKTNAQLFCNSDQTELMIKNNRSSKKNLVSLGSPWFELLMSKKQDHRKKKVIFLAPHNSMYSFDSNLKIKVNTMLANLRKICDKRSIELHLKDRRKYTNRYASDIQWDNVIYDDGPHDHIDCYKDAMMTISFCSSGINEFTFLEVPYLCACPEYQKKLNPQIHEVYYKGEIFDDVHSSQISSEEITDYDALSKKIDNLLRTSKRWKDFQRKHFTGNHESASLHILNFIEQKIAKNK